MLPKKQKRGCFRSEEVSEGCQKSYKRGVKMINGVKETKEKKGFFKLCLKEFKIAAIATIVYILISCLLSYLLGYNRSGENMTFIIGIPTWAFFGVVLPWIAMVLFTAIYAFRYMKG